MSTTPHLTLPLLAAAQAQKHVTHNEALAALDALVHLSVKERDRIAAPGSPDEGDRYLVGTGGTGSFANHDGELALFDLGVWRFFAPRPGWRAYVEAEDSIVVFNGEAWHDLGRFVRKIDNVDRLGIGTTADSLNRISAKLNAALFAALAADEGGSGDMRLVLNKSQAGNVLSQLYQRGFSGRAETGLIGTDDFSIRVSPDGSQWRDAMRIDCATGAAAFPNGLANVPGANLLINAAFLVNQRGFPGGSLGDGLYGVDRWKGGAGGCTLNRQPNGAATLTGALDQVIDVAQAAALTGSANLAGATLTLSVEDPTEPLPVMIGTRAATIPSGSGRRSATVTLGSTETGNITVRLHPTSPCGFKHVKLEIGAYATPWSGSPLDIEELRCRRYYQRLAVSGAAPGMLGVLGHRVAGNLIEIPYVLPVQMRAAPGLVTSSFAWAGGSPNGNQIGFYNSSAGAWTALTGGLSVTTVVPASSSSLVVRLQASTSFSGSSGTVGSLHLGNSASLAVQAEL